ncbi:MAG TPA: hypothetical protein VN493_26530 [Thermoanaerobaculia bacterium]|nr:hypothetical protein [Thermoanaerobaculia bacterium]
MPSNQVQHAVDTQEYLERVALSEIGEGIFVEEAGKAVPFNKSPIVTLATAEKRPVLVYSWALWSERSMRDLSHIAQLEEQHRDVIFLGLNDDIPRRRYAAQAESMAHSLETTYFIRDLGIVQSIFRDKKVDLPAYAIFNEDGEVADRFIGSIGTYPSLRRRLEGKLQSVKTNSAQPGER